MNSIIRVLPVIVFAAALFTAVTVDAQGTDVDRRMGVRGPD